jgi:hypothetical protein
MERKEQEYDVEFSVVGNFETTASGTTQQQAISRAEDNLTLEDLSVTVESATKQNPRGEVRA